jgi:hypothetical protein
MELRERHASGKFKTVAGSDPVAAEVQAHIEFTRDAAGHEERGRGHPVDRESLLKLLEFVVARGYRLGWEMVAERKRHGRPVQRAEIDALFAVPTAWMVSANGVPQRVGTGAHSRKPRVGAQPALVEAVAEHLNISKERAGDLARQFPDALPGLIEAVAEHLNISKERAGDLYKQLVDAQPGLVEAAAAHFNMSKERVADLARQLADMAGKTPWGMIGKFPSAPKPKPKPVPGAN